MCLLCDCAKIERLSLSLFFLLLLLLPHTFSDLPRNRMGFYFGGYVEYNPSRIFIHWLHLLLLDFCLFPVSGFDASRSSDLSEFQNHTNFRC